MQTRDRLLCDYKITVRPSSELEAAGSRAVSWRLPACCALFSISCVQIWRLTRYTQFCFHCKSLTLTVRFRSLVIPQQFHNIRFSLYELWCLKTDPCTPVLILTVIDKGLEGLTFVSSCLLCRPWVWQFYWQIDFGFGCPIAGQIAILQTGF